MICDVIASILKPNEEGSFLVVVSAFPADTDLTIGGQPHRSAVGRTESEADLLRDRLIAQVSAELTSRGHELRRVVHR